MSIWIKRILVVGQKEQEANAVVLRTHGSPQGAKPKADVIAGILASIKERRA